MTRITTIVSVILLCVTTMALAVDNAQVELEAQYVLFKSSDIQKLAARGSVTLSDLQELRKKGNSELLYAPLRMVNSVGIQGTVKAVTEYIYPTDFEVQTIKEDADVILYGKSRRLVAPGAFQTREIGALLEAIATVTESGRIEVTMTPQVVYKTPPNVFKAKYVDENGKETTIDIEQPLFRVFSTTVTVIMNDGETTFFGALDNPTGEQTLYLFVTARLLKADQKKMGTESNKSSEATR